MESGVSNERFEAFRNELETQAKVPPKGDERIRAYSRASLDALENLPPYKNVIQQAIEAKPDYPPSAVVNLTLRALQRQLIVRERSGYPEIFTDSAPWLDSIEFASDPTSSIHADYLYDVTERGLTSNIANRYRSVKLVTQLMRSRLGDRPSILDIGCSQNHGLKKLAMSRKFPFPDIVAGELKVNEDGYILGLVKNQETTDYVNQELHQPLRIHRAVGVDIVPIYDEATKNFAFSCAHRPSELLDKANVREYKILDETEKKSVRFYQGNFAELDIDELREQSGVSQFDMITFSTVLYQAKEPVRNIMLERAKQLLKPNGVILVQDFLDIDAQDPAKLNFYDNWFNEEYRYRTLLLDPAISQDSFTELFRWDTSRCNLLVVSTDIHRESNSESGPQEDDYPRQPSDPTFPLKAIKAYASRTAKMIRKQS